MAENIRRSANRTKNFTTISNEIFRNDKISARAKGLYAYIMTLPDDWTIHTSEVFKHFTEGRDAMRKAFGELVEAGYVKHEIVRDAGRIDHLYIIYETVDGKSGPEKPAPVKPATENPAPENPPLLNTNGLNTDLPNTDKLKTDKLPASLSLAEPKKKDDLAVSVYKAIQSKASDPKFDKVDWIACTWMAGRARELFPADPGGFLAAVLEEWTELRRTDRFYGKQPWRPKTLRASYTWAVVCDRLAERTRVREGAMDGPGF